MKGTFLIDLVWLRPILNPVTMILDKTFKHLCYERKDWMFAFLLMAKAFLALEKFEDARNALEKTIFLAKIGGMKIPRKSERTFARMFLEQN